DYSSPLTITHQACTKGKCYGVIMICTAVRLILDIVSDLITATFLMLLHRFFARREIPKSIT
ncbi:hypothetical protein Angca_001993, partial [Angiostrongylus cantonensis]